MPSSREDVDRDSSWNQWLRSEIHSLFIDALEVFKVFNNILCLFDKRESFLTVFNILMLLTILQDLETYKFYIYFKYVLVNIYRVSVFGNIFA